MKIGIVTIESNGEGMSNFYSNPNENHFNLLPNTYVVLQEEETKQIINDTYLWNGKYHEKVKYHSFESSMFGRIFPKTSDPYQTAYFDSIVRNQITFCTGPGGSGKSQIALAYCFQELQKNRISQIVIFCNPYQAKDSVKLGYLPGDEIDKLLETSIGSILISKLGGSPAYVAGMIQKGLIKLMPIGSCRGYEVPQNAIVYFTEAQNLSPYLMKLFLQRLTDDCKVIVEGDVRQYDSNAFRGEKNGLAKAIEVFVGEDYAGHVNLVNNYRGKISRKAEEICEE